MDIPNTLVTGDYLNGTPTTLAGAVCGKSPGGIGSLLKSYFAG